MVSENQNPFHISFRFLLLSYNSFETSIELLYEQNLAEAEYTVGTFMYMRLLGYPADKITILTTYNGQKHLIRDVVKQRCATNPFIGFPSKVCLNYGNINDF